ncbi:hypothetical protein [Herbaspirillum robiniae]|uniref:Uncharacterized protein n=1 Tax=Herbaspirillum robiniae TaxID=2014887 RepID=A0ABX2M0T4_9BURK|nr:hypothetical protein [Herbaspirillum robiniae]NUU02833.1 hypothetical protein [Herbaspirillum robiniae]
MSKPTLHGPVFHALRDIARLSVTSLVNLAGAILQGPQHLAALPIYDRAHRRPSSAAMSKLAVASGPPGTGMTPPPIMCPWQPSPRGEFDIGNRIGIERT